jgi:hypothetical protein
MMSTALYRLTTVYSLRNSPEQAHQPARKAQHEGEREGDGEEDVLVGDVGVEAAFYLHIPHFLTPTHTTLYSRSTD